METFPPGMLLMTDCGLRPTAGSGREAHTAGSVRRLRALIQDPTVAGSSVVSPASVPGRPGT